MSGYVRREYPQWSWSFSRNQMFKSCARRYYYNYYGSHNGWEFSAPPSAALAYRLKKLTSLYLVLGDALHKSAEHIVERVIAGHDVPSADFVEEEVRRQLRRVWTSSQKAQELFMQRPNRVDMLHEFYYGMEISKQTIEKINLRATKVAKALVKSEIWEELRKPDTELVSCEQFDTFPLNGTPIYAVPDVLYKTSAGQWVIVDWKTGEEVEENRDQVALYALYVVKKHGVEVEAITARLEYLNLDTVESLNFTMNELEAVEHSAIQSMEEMQNLLLDPEVNKPMPKEKFALTDARGLCPWCNYYELCREELEENPA